MPAARPDPTQAAGPTRRSVLRAGLVGLAAAGALAGCSGSAPRTPWSPDPDVGEDEPRRLPPDADLLLDARERVHRYRTVLAQVRPPGRASRSAARHLAEVWPVQQERIEQLLTLDGVDLPALEPAEPGGPDLSRAAATDDAAVSSSRPRLDPEELGAEIRADLPAALAGLARSTVSNRAMLTSLLAQHAEAARLLRAPVEWEPLAGPVGPAAVPVLQVTRPAVFGLEVVAARSRGEERELFESVLAPLQRVTRALTTLAGDAAPVPPLGYDLPEPLDDAESRMSLARALVADVAPAALSTVDRAGSDEAQLWSVVRLVAEATAWGRELGARGVPFPGMTLP